MCYLCTNASIISESGEDSVVQGQISRALHSWPICAGMRAPSKQPHRAGAGGQGHPTANCLPN